MIVEKKYVHVGSELRPLRNIVLYPNSRLNDQKFEFVLLLDLSSCTNDERTKLVKDALLLYLQSLPTDCCFNVMVSQNERFFETSAKYSQETLREAKEKVNGLKPGMMTDLYESFIYVYSQPRIMSYITQIFAITDEEIGKRDMVLELIRSKSAHCHSFASAIGDKVATDLYIGTAKNARDMYYFDAWKEGIEPNILAQLKLALKPDLLQPMRDAAKSVLIPMCNKLNY